MFTKKKQKDEKEKKSTHIYVDIKIHVYKNGTNQQRKIID